MFFIHSAKKDKFINTGNYGYGVSGNLISIDPESKAYLLKLNVYNPIEGEWETDMDYPPQGYVFEDNVDEMIKGLDDAAIFELINGEIATDEEIKQLQEASKNHLNGR